MSQLVVLRYSCRVNKFTVWTPPVSVHRHRTWSSNCKVGEEESLWWRLGIHLQIQFSYNIVGSLRDVSSLLRLWSAQQRHAVLISPSHVAIGKSGVNWFALEFITRSFPSSCSIHVDASCDGWKAQEYFGSVSIRSYGEESEVKRPMKWD